MNKKEIFTFRGLNQDLSKSKHPKEFYYEANAIRITATNSQSTGSVTNEKGTEFTLSIPNPVVNVASNTISYNNKTLKFLNQEIKDQFENTTSGDQIIISHTIARNNIILFSTDNNGYDCIWQLTESSNDIYDLELMYIRKLGFSTSAPIQSIFNFENENIQKIYWVDGKNQLRFLNLEHSKENDNSENLIDIASNTINIVGNFNITQPKITDIVSGGTHTSGMIQYAYNLYRLNSSQTKLSPLSGLVPLDKGRGQGGGEVNEIVGSTPVVTIDNIDKEYTHIKVYAIKYTSYNQIPTISLIEDKEIPSNNSISIFDDGNVINDMSLSEFLFLGSDPIIPKHIESKDNYLFSANIKDKAFDIELDTRAYSFSSNGTNTRVYDSLRAFNGNVIGASINVNNNYSVPKKHDSINKSYDLYKYQYNSTILGGEGKYLKYEIVQDSDLKNPENKKFFKDNEVYRLGIQFYNRLGQKSLPKWIADYKMPEGNLEGNYNMLKVTLQPEFYVWLNTSSNFESEDDKPIGYKVLRANRTQNDKTIITQGFLNGMMSNFRAEDKSNEFSSQARYRAQEGNKLPSLQRVYGKHHTQMEGMKHNLKLDDFDSTDDGREVHKASASENWIAETFQYNTLMQMFSPEVLFGNVSLYEGLNLRIKGALKSAETKFWGQARKASTKEIVLDGKVLNGLSPHEDINFTDTGETEITGSINELANYGIFGPAGKNDNNEEMDFYQFYRNFTGDYYSSTGKQYPVYGKPELAEKGQGATNYNNDANFKYYNSLQPMIADGGDGRGENSAAITSVNSWGAKNLTFVLGADDKKINPQSRHKLEDLWSQSGITESDVILIGEFVKNNTQIYLGGIYGGNTYEDKKRTSYIEIGDYTNINTDNVYIDSPGDTFVSKFRFGKILKTDTEVYSTSSLQISEIVEGYIESTIDLKNRNDISLGGWDSRFQPREEEYHKYNRVYSQEPTVVLEQDIDYNFKKVKNFDSRIISSKVKIPGENIDSWTDILVNEVQDLNGKFGPINGLCSFRDNIYAFQDKAFAYVSINPRVQVQGSDGIAVELGSGNILHDYKYISTNSGSINKWAIQSTQYGIYYLDAINRTFNRFNNNLEKLSDIKGLHTWFNNNIDYNDISQDNPILGKGAHISYDIINNTVMLTLNQKSSYTRVFSEITDTFFGLMPYTPKMYIANNSRLFSINDNNSLHEHFKGEYNKFYGVYHPSTITLLVNPDVNYDCVFNNIEYRSELYLDGKDQSDKTLTHIRAYNEYQDSGKIPLLLGRDKNLRRKFRAWRADIPRDGRDRIRNPWIYLDLELDNTNNYKFIMHDMIVSYNAS